ncbi:MAG TPA: response regulator transcription factor, partial [Candidatus Limnocylindrales bacterium]|nr:response regulator transcription factor [Candidatus Limnocylindrales bacterium]
MTQGLGAESAAAAPDRAPTPLDRPVRVGLIEDHNLVREGLRLVLTANGFDVVGESPSVEGAFDLLEQTRPDVILLDLSLVDGDGVSLLRELHTRSPQTRVVVVTMHRDPETVRQALV